MDPIEKSLGLTHWECAPECVLNVPLSVTMGSWLLHCLFLVGLGWKQFCSALFSHHEALPLHVPKNQWVHPAMDHKVWNYSPFSLRKIILSGILLWWQKADYAVIVSHLQWIQLVVDALSYVLAHWDRFVILSNDWAQFFWFVKPR